MIEQINEWINFIQKPRVELGGFSVCPYAKLAVRTNSYTIVDVSLARIEQVMDEIDLSKHLVTVLVLRDYLQYDESYLLDVTKGLNKKYNPKDLVVLENDPRSPMVINGVTTTFAECFLWLIQSLSDLNKKSGDLEKTTYYSYWTQKQLDEVVSWRT